MAMYDYQYDSTARQLDKEYNKPIAKKVKKKSKSRKVKVNHDFKNKSKTILYVAIIFSTLFAISYRNSQINESFKTVQNLSKESGILQKENDQIEIEIESNLNLSSIEQAAKEMLGMQKLVINQKEYISLPKADYVEPASEEIVIEEKVNIFTKIINMITK